jgi:hypothetical protein
MEKDSICKPTVSALLVEEVWPSFGRSEQALLRPPFGDLAMVAAE